MESIIDLDQLIEHYKADPAMTRAKWVQWAIVCAERTLPLFTSISPDDDRPANAIAAAKAWLHNPTKKAAHAAHAAASAARAAAYAADAAHAAADAADVTHAAHAAADAAYAAHAAHVADATHAAADAAAYAAADAAHAADATETQWQAFRLMEIYHA